MHMDEIQYTLNHVKLLLILSIHENERCILENQKLVKLKPINFWIFLCVYLSISKLNYPYTRSKKINKPKLKSSGWSSSSRRLDPNMIQRAWLLLEYLMLSWRTSSWINTCQLWFMTLSPLLKLNTNNDLNLYLKLNKHKIISTITTWVNHHQN